MLRTLSGYQHTCFFYGLLKSINSMQNKPCNIYFCLRYAKQDVMKFVRGQRQTTIQFNIIF